tara:strand:+ start:217 stop:360 length:144 start_codon:yes stop_codon:yes gene_type:complete
MNQEIRKDILVEMVNRLHTLPVVVEVVQDLPVKLRLKDEQEMALQTV